MANANKIIIDRSLEYATDLELYKGNLARKIERLLLQVRSEIGKEITKISPRDREILVRRRNRLAKIKRTLDKSLKRTFKNVRKNVTKELRIVGDLEFKNLNGILDEVVGVAVNAVGFTPVQLKAIASNIIIEGAAIQDIWKRQTRATRDKVVDEIRNGLIRNETNQQIVQRIRGRATGKWHNVTLANGKKKRIMEFRGGVMQTQTRQAQAIARTAVQTVSQEVRLKTIEANLNIIDEIYVLATLDSRTTPICINLSGQRWKLPDYIPVGLSSSFPGPPPWHINCRSTLIPVTKSWEDLAPKTKKSIGRKLDKAGKSIKRTQASMDGQVPSGMDYEKWFATKSSSFQKQKLGPTRYKLYKEGKVKSLRALIDDGKYIPIKTLERRVKRKIAKR